MFNESPRITTNSIQSGAVQLASSTVRSFCIRTDAVEELVGADEQAISVDGWAAVKDRAIAQVVDGKLFKIGLRSDDKRSSIAG